MLRVCLLAVALVSSTDSSRILACLPFAGYSHHLFARTILEELASRGHEVVYLTAVPYENVPANIKQIDISHHVTESFDPRALLEYSRMSVLGQLITLNEIGLEQADGSLRNPEVQELIHSNEHFDAVLMESFFGQEYISAFTHKFGALGIEIFPFGYSAWVNELSGLADNTAYQRDYRNEYPDLSDLLGRLYNSYVTASTTLLGYYYLWKKQSVVDRYFDYPGAETRPSLTYLASNRSLILTNSHFALGYPAPLAPHHKEIGGVHIRPVKPLPKDLQKYMDEAESGVIYMSLGSRLNISDVMDDRLQEDLMSVFGALKQKVLFKWDIGHTRRVPQNVWISKWFPTQQDILAHKNVVLFISHGGLLSVQEAVYYGVPIVGIPFYGDQKRNMMQIETAGYGKMLMSWNLTGESVSWAVNEVINNKRYKTEAHRRSAKLRDRRLSPAEEAVHWIEHSIRFPNSLTPGGAHLSFVRLHGLDVLAFVAAVTAILLSGFVSLCRRCKCSKKTSRPTTKVKEQ